MDYEYITGFSLFNFFCARVIFSVQYKFYKKKIKLGSLGSFNVVIVLWAVTGIKTYVSILFGY